MWWREFRLVLRDEGVVIFFFGVCLIYPILYSLIYNPEVLRDEAVVVVDDCRTQLSRELSRRLDATPEVRVAAVAANMQEARELLRRKRCYAIVHVSRDFSQAVARGGQGHVDVYCDMSVMVRYKNALMAVTAVTQDMGGEVMQQAVAPLTNQPATVIESRQVPYGNNAMGLASTVLLFVLPLVLQQSMLLGIGMLHGGSVERRRRHRGRDPLDPHAGVLATVLGKTLCHATVYLAPVVYVLLLTPMMFDFPHNANLLHALALAVPFVIAVSMMGQTLQAFVNERESVFVLFAFTSVIFIFLTGVSWPRYQMSPFWHTIGNCVPTTWMSNAYVLMQSTGASLDQLSHYHHMLWLQAGVMFVLACAVERFVSRPRYRRWQQMSDDDTDALHRYDLLKNGIG